MIGVLILIALLGLIIYWMGEDENDDDDDDDFFFGGAHGFKRIDTYA